MNVVALLSSCVTASADAGNEIGIGWMALYSVIGMLLVIAVLIILIVLLMLISKIVKAIPDKSKSAKKSAAEPAPSAPLHAEDEEETVAAITAALMAYYAGEGKTAVTDGEDIPVPFVIKSIRKI